MDSPAFYVVMCLLCVGVVCTDLNGYDDKCVLLNPVHLVVIHKHRTKMHGMKKIYFQCLNVATLYLLSGLLSFKYVSVTVV
jgi:hypothetical protein